MVSIIVPVYGVEKYIERCARSLFEQTLEDLEFIFVNDKTKDQMGSIIPVVITVYEDRTFTFETKTPPASDLLKKAAGINKGASSPKKQKVATITKAQCLEIAKTKMPDLNAYDEEAAARIIEGTARQMGIVVE